MPVIRKTGLFSITVWNIQPFPLTSEKGASSWRSNSVMTVEQKVEGLPVEEGEEVSQEEEMGCLLMYVLCSFDCFLCWW